MKQFLLTIILCLSLAISSFAQHSGTTGTLVWSIDTAGTLRISGTGEVPNPYDNDKPWDEFEESIKKIVISEGITGIGNWAFFFYDITSVSIGNSVKSIGTHAFACCYELNSVTIGNSVTSIGRQTFSSCTALTSITIPNSVTNIGESAFFDCTNLSSITIPNSVTSIGESAFAWTGLTSFTIPDGVTSIENNTFQDCNNLTSITIPESVTSIGDYAFGSCNSLTSAVIGDGVESIGDGAFSVCSSLTSIIIPNSVTSIGGWAFQDCNNLTSITIGRNVTSIGPSAFSNITLETLNYNAKNYTDAILVGAWLWPDITTLIIGEDVENIPDNAFSGFSNLISVTIGNNVKRIGKSAFQGCTALPSITIPDGVVDIGDAAFWLCSDLTSITVSNNVTNIRYLTFSGCSSLTSVAIPNSVTTIETRAFSDCSNLTSISIGTGLADIGPEVFSGCVRLEHIYAPRVLPPVVYHSTSFEEVNFSSCVLHVPAESIDAYKAAAVWRNFNNIIAISSVVAEEPEPTGNDGKGSLDFFLEIPGNATITGSFNIQLPEGYTIDEANTILSETLAEQFKLVITSTGDNTWNIEIVPNGLRAGHDFPEYTKIMSIGYIVDKSVLNGSYQIELKDINMQLEDGTSIEQESIIATAEVQRSETSISATEVNPVNVHSISEGIVIENALVGETIQVYSIVGVLIQTHNIAFPQTTIVLPQGIYIVKVGEASFKVMSGK